MLIIPAIDLKDGKCVRLKQGAMDEVTVFSDDPVAMAGQWLKLGARRLHVIDLNGAAAGRPKNEPAIKAIAEAVGDKLPIQLGGGINGLEDVKALCKVAHEGITGAITGRAIYEGKLDFAAAQKLADKLSKKD